jgi:hypothetical protein
MGVNEGTLRVCGRISGVNRTLIAFGTTLPPGIVERQAPLRLERAPRLNKELGLR